MFDFFILPIQKDAERNFTPIRAIDEDAKDEETEETEEKVNDVDISCKTSGRSLLHRTVLSK